MSLGKLWNNNTRKLLAFSIVILLIFILGKIFYNAVFHSFPSINSVPETDNTIVIDVFREQSLYVLNVDSETIYRWDWPDEVCMGILVWSHSLQAFTSSGHVPTQSCSYRGRIESGVYSLSLDGSVVKVSSLRLGHYGEHSWSPDGTQIVFSCSPDSAKTVERTEICVRSKIGDSLRRITDLENEAQFPKWSPVSNKIVFETFDYDSYTSGTHYRIFKIDEDGENLTELTSNLDGNNLRPQWSPDGTKIAFLHSSIEPSDPDWLWVMDANGDNLTPIFDLPNIEVEKGTGVTAFAWDPTGEKFVFTSGHEGTCRTIKGLDADFTKCDTGIYTINLDGTNLTKLGNYDISPREIFWLP